MPYPILTSYLDATIPANPSRGSRRERFTKSIETVGLAVQQGSIPNMTFNGCKDIINAAIDDAIDSLRRQYINGRRSELSDVVRKFDSIVSVCCYVNLVPGRLTKLKALYAGLRPDERQHPYIKAMLEMLTEVAPLAAVMADLKGDKDHPTKITKRTVKPVEERKPGYHPPPVSTEGEKRVLTLLESVTEAAYGALVNGLVCDYTVKLMGFLAAAKAATGRFSPYHYFIQANPRYPDHSGYHLVDKLVVGHNVGCYEAVPDAEKIILAEATQVADDCRMAFVHKNLCKIASIVDGKGNLDTAEVIERSVSLGGLKGTFVFRFKDKSRFTVVNSVVYVTNNNGTHFSRYPLTFHNVFLAGGIKMKQPSEARMNTVFLGK